MSLNPASPAPHAAPGSHAFLAPLSQPVTGHYQAPRWLRGGHAQTIYPATCLPRPPVRYRRERWTTPDADFIDLDFVEGQPGQPLLVLFHGLEGSADSHYARALMHAATALNWAGVVVHFRGCSGEANLMPRFYHSGDAEEIDWIVQRLHQQRLERGVGALHAVGISLGGNALLRWLGESPQHASTMLSAACAISAPLNLTQGGAALSRGINRIYTHAFLRSLKPKCLRKLEQFPGLYDRQRLLQARNLYEFDNIVTAPLHGYRNTDDYWHRASSCHVLTDIRVPTLVLNAQNDPFLPARYLPPQASAKVLLEYPAEGGHAGFVSGRAPGSLAWLPQRIVQFLQRGH